LGRVYQFDPQPEQIELDIDLPLFTQVNAPLELLIQMEEKDLVETGSQRLERIRDLDDDIKALLRRNAGITVEGQLALLEVLDEKMDEYYPFLKWSNIPTYEQLKGTLELAWNYLLSPGESKAGVRTPAQLAVATLQYYQRKSLKALIQASASSGFWKQRLPDSTSRIQAVVASFCMFPVIGLNTNSQNY